MVDDAMTDLDLTAESGVRGGSVRSDGHRRVDL